MAGTPDDETHEEQPLIILDEWDEDEFDSMTDNSYWWPNYDDE